MFANTGGWQTAVDIPWGADDFELRETIVDMTGNTGDGGQPVVGLSLDTGNQARLHDVVVRADEGLIAEDSNLGGVELSGGAEIDVQRLTIELSRATSENQTGLEIYGRSGVLDRVHVRVGGGVYWNQGVSTQCSGARFWNSVFETEALNAGTGIGAEARADCSPATTYHSCLILSDSRDTSLGLTVFGSGSTSPHLVNTIIHAGRSAKQRYALAPHNDFTGTLDLDSVVLVVDPIGATDAASLGREIGWEVFESDPDLVGAVGCTDCVTVVEDVPFADEEKHDFHILQDASCCTGTGSPLGVDDPPWDADQVPRSVESPSIGPYEPND